MIFNTVAIAALTCASTIAALPGLKHSHRHQHQQPEKRDLSDVDWNKALANVDWGKVNFNVAANNNNNKLAAGQQTVTVAVVGKTSTVINAAAPTTTKPATVAAPAVPTTPTTVAAPTTLQPATPAATTTAAASNNNGGSTSGLLNMVPSADQYSIKVINNCDHTVWQAGWQTNTARALIDSRVKGNMMPAGSSITLAIPKKALGVQIWAREGCTGSSSGSDFHCSVGDCQGFQCSSIIWQGGPILAEFGAGLDTDMYNTDITAYDISAIPGNNVGVSIQPSVASCWKKLCPKSGCSTDQAWQKDSDIALGSPADTTCTNAANFVVTFCPASSW